MSDRVAWVVSALGVVVTLVSLGWAVDLLFAQSHTVPGAVALVLAATVLGAVIVGVGVGLRA
ncbi:MAG: hypothetical protein ABEI75_01930 [Halobaculum sp.]